MEGGGPSVFISSIVILLVRIDVNNVVLGDQRTFYGFRTVEERLCFKLRQRSVRFTLLPNSG